MHLVVLEFLVLRCHRPLVHLEPLVLVLQLCLEPLAHLEPLALLQPRWLPHRRAHLAHRLSCVLVPHQLGRLLNPHLLQLVSCGSRR